MRDLFHENHVSINYNKYKILFTWNDYLKIRKAKKAPITETAIQALIREADKAGKSLSQAITICVENNWVGFKAEWESVKQAPSDQPKKWPGI